MNNSISEELSTTKLVQPDIVVNLEISRRLLTFLESRGISFEPIGPSGGLFLRRGAILGLLLCMEYVVGFT